MSDLECPATSDGGPYAGYRDLYAFACDYNCQAMGIDPISGLPYGAHDCAPLGQQRQLPVHRQPVRREDCVQLGGASVGSPDQLCCGEDRDHRLRTTPASRTPPTPPTPARRESTRDSSSPPAPPWCLPTCSTAMTSFPDGGALTAFDEQFVSCSVDAGLLSSTAHPTSASSRRRLRLLDRGALRLGVAA